MDRFDYHVHTFFSHDGSCSPIEQLDAAANSGVKELCFTDHVDFDVMLEPYPRPRADIGKLKEELGKIGDSYKGVRIKLGSEISLDDKSAAANAESYILPFDVDFVIGSVHLVDGIDTYSKEYFAGRTRQDAYYSYLDMILRGIQNCQMMSVLGHYDFVTKYAPFDERRMTLDVSYEVFTEIFKILISRGKGIEINTSAWWDEPKWGLDILKRYRELGGEFVTTGSDAHRAERVGNRLDEAIELAREAGIGYLATFEHLIPVFHRI